MLLDLEIRSIRHIGRFVTSESTWQMMHRRSRRHPVRHLVRLLPTSILRPLAQRRTHLQQLALLPPLHYDFRIWLCHVLFCFLLWRCFPDDSRTYHLDVSMMTGIYCIQIGHGQFHLDLCRTITAIPTHTYPSLFSRNFYFSHRTLIDLPCRTAPQPSREKWGEFEARSHAECTAYFVFFFWQKVTFSSSSSGLRSLDR
jgi:hypothetical protein